MDEETKEAMASGRPVNIWHIGSIGQMNPNATTVTNNYYGDQFAPKKESNNEDSDDEPPAEEWRNRSVEERIKLSILKMQKEDLFKKAYDYTWIMLFMNEVNKNKNNEDYEYKSLELPAFNSSQSFADYLKNTLQLKDTPSRSTIGERKNKTCKRFPWSFEDTSDVTETNRRNNIVRRFLALYTKGR